MTPDQRTAVECVVLILRRRSDRIILSEEDYLDMNIDELELESIDRLDLIMELERRFDVVFTTSSITHCNTIDDMLAVVRDESSRVAE